MKILAVGFVSILVLPLVLCSSIACAFEWDQRNDPPTYFGMRNIIYWPLVGQEFVPDSGAINVVQFWMQNGVSEVNGSLELAIRLREASIFGDILATSSTVSLPQGYYDIATFHFPITNLTPGAKYVFEFVPPNGEVLGYWFAAFTSHPPSDDYERGNCVIDGVVQNIQDFWFREGVDVAVSNTRSSWGSVKALFAD